MIALLAPLGLATLAALAIPLLIHLMRRFDGPEVPFAALRWVPPRQRSQARRRLHERLLLLLRLLLLASLALLLASPVWRQPPQQAGAWVLVAPGVDAAAAQASLGAGQTRRLAPGFPPLDAPAQAGATASLIRQFDAELPAGAALTIVVPEELGGLDAERLQLSRPVEWVVQPGRSPVAADELPDRAPAAAVAPRLAELRFAGPATSLDTALAALAALLFVLERLCAARRVPT